MAYTRPYGAERVAIEVARGLARLGHDVTYVSYYEQRDVDAAQLLGPGVNYVTLSRRGRSLLSMIQTVVRLRRVLNKGKPSVVVSLLPAANLMAVLAARLMRPRIPLVITEHSIPSVSLSRGLARPQRMYQLVLRRLYRRAQAAIAVTTPVAVDLVRVARLEPTRVHVVPNPIDVERVKSSALEPLATFPWPDESNVLVCVAAVNYAKRPMLLLEVMTHLPSDYKLVMVGDGPLLDEVRAAVVRFELGDRVILTGWCDNPHPWVARSRALVLLSVVEGFGLVVAEAAALGVPAITSGAGGLAETTPATNGRVIPVEDPELVADAIREFVSSPPDPVVPDAWRADAVAKRYAVILHSVASPQ